MTTPNDIPDILAGTIGTEQNAYNNDPNAVAAALAQDPNLLAEVLQPGFVEVVNELAGDAAPTLGTPETVSQAYQDGNNESLTDAYNDLQASSSAVSDTAPGVMTDADSAADPLNPQPLPPAQDPVDQIHDQLEQIQSELASLSGAEAGTPTDASPGMSDPSSEFPTFETLQPEFMTAEAPSYEAPASEAPYFEAPSSFESPTYEAPTYESAQAEPSAALPNDVDMSMGAMGAEPSY